MAAGAGATVSIREVTKENLREIFRLKVHPEQERCVAPNAVSTRAIEQVIDYVRQRPGAREFFTSVLPGEGSPGPFYEKLGFAYTGEMDEGERVMRKPLQP